jgi:hypothetical protein
MCTVALTTCTSFFGSVKVNRISIWAPPASQGASATVSVNWYGYANSPNREVSDTTISTSKPAHVVSTPPTGSLASFWQTVGTNTIFSIVAPTGAIIDITLSLILSDDENTLPATTTAGGTLGVNYYLSLDPNVTHRFTPVSLTTTT